MFFKYAKTFILCVFALGALLLFAYLFTGSALVGNARRAILIFLASLISALIYYFLTRKQTYNAFQFAGVLAIAALTANSIVSSYNEDFLRRYSFEPRFTILAIKGQPENSGLKLVIKQENPGTHPSIKCVSVNPSFIYEDPASEAPLIRERALTSPKSFMTDDLTPRDKSTVEIRNLSEVLCAEKELSMYCRLIDEGKARFKALYVELEYDFATRHPRPNPKGDGYYVIPEHEISIIE